MTEAALDRLISSDSHVNAPIEMWRDYLPAEFRDLAPRMEQVDDGDFSIFEGRRQAQVGQSVYGDIPSAPSPSGPMQLALPDAAPILIFLAALLLALLAYLLSGSLLLAIAAAIVGATLAALWPCLRRR